MQIVKYQFQQYGDERGMLVALEEYGDIPGVGITKIFLFNIFSSCGTGDIKTIFI